MGLGLLLTGSNAQIPDIGHNRADKFIQKYHSSLPASSCGTGKRPTEITEGTGSHTDSAYNDPDRRAAFINSVAAPIANKMFRKLP